MRIVQPSVAKRIAFSRWARKAGLRRYTTVSYFLPEDIMPPAELMVGAQIDGKPYEPKPKPTRARRTRSEPKPESTPEPDLEPEIVPEPERSYGTVLGTLPNEED
jgi:cell division septation protein DedD